MFTTPIWKALRSPGSSQANSLHIKELRAPHPPKGDLEREGPIAVCSVSVIP